MRIKVLVLVSGLLIFVGACSPKALNTNTGSNVAKADTPAPATSASPAEVQGLVSGAKLYATNCMTCHQDSGKGGKVTVDGKTMEPDDLTSAKMKAKTDEKLYSYIADGIVDEGMPAFKDKMSVDEMKAVVKHVRDLQK